MVRDVILHARRRVHALVRLLAGDYPNARKLGTDRLFTIDELVDIVCNIAGAMLTWVLDSLEGLEEPCGGRRASKV